MAIRSLQLMQRMMLYCWAITKLAQLKTAARPILTKHQKQKKTQTSLLLRFDAFFTIKISTSCLFVSDNFLFDFFPILSV